MKDTSEVMSKEWDARFMKMSPEDRLKMACSMFDFAREIVVASIKNELPDISETELKKRVLVRMYPEDSLSTRC